MPTNTMLKCLFLETSTERAIVAAGTIAADGDGQPTVLATEELPFGLQSSRFLIPRIEAMLQEAGIAMSSLQAIAVGQGPGSYTGIRVGVSVARTLAYALKVPLVAVPTLCGFVPDDDGTFTAVIDAKISGVYVLKGERAGATVRWNGEPQAIPVAELPDYLEGSTRFVTPQAARIQPLIEGVCAASASSKLQWVERTPSADAYLLEAQRRYQAGQYTTDATCEVLYLRKTQAEIERGAS